MNDCDVTALRLAGEASSAAFDDPDHPHRCAACRRLTAADLALAPPALDPVRPGDALRAALDRDLRPLRYRGAWERATLPALSLAAVMVSGVTMLDRATATTATPWLASALMLGFAGAGVVLALRRGESGLGVPVALRRGYMAGAFALFALSLVARSSAASGGPRGAGAAAHVGVSAVNAVADPHHEVLGPMQNLGTCASTASVFAGVVALAVLWSARRSVPVSSGSMGAVVGAAAGLAAAAALEPACGSGVQHTLAAHGLPMVAATVLCVFFGRRALAP